jgi:beta-lactamase superfamily II metal-dependent hydrolase
MKKKATKPKNSSPSAEYSYPNRIRIRMYRVGFGDCFLVSFPLAGDYKHVLVDCGVHTRGDIGTMDRVVADIEKATSGKLALVVATHAHQDHISGFGKGKEVFNRFYEVEQVWMPWTENPDDDQASKLKRKRMALAMQLQQHFAVAANASQEAMAAVMNIAGNQAALDFLHSGFNGKAEVRYLQAGDKITKPPIPGLSVKVLGPPRDQTFLSKMDPPAGQRYLRLGDNGHALQANVLKPFGDKWVVPRKDKALDHLRMDEASEKQVIEQLTDASLEELAFTVDQALNNTSVVLLLTFAGQNLLFPGDAQYGNWKVWLDQEGSDELLAGVHFYKVSHHGSFNATPKSAVEKMNEFAAMVSTQNVPWASIPRLPLMKALAERSKNKVIRSDSLAVQGAIKAPEGPAVSKLPQNFEKGEFWYDYFIPV